MIPIRFVLYFSALAAMSAAAPAQDAPLKIEPRPAPVPVSPAMLNAKLAKPLPADQAAMKAHVLFLASDAMKGREAGSPEYDIAAQYVASRFYAAGLRPGGDAGGYLQKVPLVAYRSAGEGDLVWLAGGREDPVRLIFGEDYVPSANPASVETSITAPVVFVGYGIDAPQYKHNDYRRIDVRGKIVAFFSGAPARFGGEERAFFGSARTKAAIAAGKGAAGTITIDSPGSRRPFSRLVQNFDAERITWAKPDGTGASDASGAPALATISASGAAKLFAGAETGWDRIEAMSSDANAGYRPVALKGRLAVATRTQFSRAESRNVVGLVPGSDPKLKDEVVILSAHLDHIGTGRPVDGDSINNGALDNAIGIASLIEEAKRFTAADGRPKRTVMFLAVTAEEKGLIGSDYFANHPTVPIDSIVADINLDMPILLYPFEDMIVYGAERSTLGPIVRRAVESAGVELSPDPMPEQGIFVRSDHFRFVQKGIPSVFLWPGQKGPGKDAVAHFMSANYHRPSDDLSQPIDWAQGVRFVGVNYRIAREVADAPVRPVWNKGDYFGTLYKGRMAAE